MSHPRSLAPAVPRGVQQPVQPLAVGEAPGREAIPTTPLPLAGWRAGSLRSPLLHRAIRWESLQVKPPSDVLIVISKDGRSSKPFVFTIHSQQMSHPSQSLDVAADTQEELNDWVAKIREATQNADARVSGGSRGPGTPWLFAGTGRGALGRGKTKVSGPCFGGALMPGTPKGRALPLGVRVRWSSALMLQPTLKHRAKTQRAKHPIWGQKEIYPPGQTGMDWGGERGDCLPL